METMVYVVEVNHHAKTVSARMPSIAEFVNPKQMGDIPYSGRQEDCEKFAKEYAVKNGFVYTPTVEY
jgi:hypothetical protein